MESWAIIAIVAIVFGSIVSIVRAGCDHELQEKKIEAALRQQEMENGVAPGTYTGKRARKQAEKAFKATAKQERYRRRHHLDEQKYEEPDIETERERLKKGIDNLQQRIDNIEIIMKSRNNSAKNNDNAE
jgi:vacuolar-type H+-ATPase subunit I/STV1